MFITVKYGGPLSIVRRYELNAEPMQKHREIYTQLKNSCVADNQIILNPNCKVVNLAEILKEKCQCGPEVSLDLLDESGNLINLSDMEGSQDLATNYLRERQCYVLVRIIRGDGSEPARYESMLDNLSKRHPELAERLQKLSRPHFREKMRNSVSKKGRPAKETPLPTPSKSRTVSQQKNRLS